MDLVSQFTEPSYMDYIEFVKSSQPVLKVTKGVIGGKYKLPEIKDVNDRLVELSHERQDIMKGLYHLQQKVALSKSPQLLKQDYDNFIFKLHVIDEEKDTLEIYKTKVFNPEIDYYIVKQPSIVTKKAVSPSQIAVVVTNKKKKALTEEQKEKVIKNTIKMILKPKTKEECVSKAKSKPFFMSLKEILEYIEENPELKSSLPKNYKSLTKEQLCDAIYLKKN
jgi:hypothetical protein